MKISHPLIDRDRRLSSIEAEAKLLAVQEKLKEAQDFASIKEKVLKDFWPTDHVAAPFIEDLRIREFVAMPVEHILRKRSFTANKLDAILLAADRACGAQSAGRSKVLPRELDLSGLELQERLLLRFLLERVQEAPDPKAVFAELVHGVCVRMSPKEFEKAFLSLVSLDPERREHILQSVFPLIPRAIVVEYLKTLVLDISLEEKKRKKPVQKRTQKKNVSKATTKKKTSIRLQKRVKLKQPKKKRT